MFTVSRARRSVSVALSVLSLPGLAFAANASLHGSITDPAGANVRNATVEVLEGDRVVATAITNADGFRLSLPAGRYQLRVMAEGFAIYLSSPVMLDACGAREEAITLKVKTLQEQVTVTATGTSIPQAQTAAAITVLSNAEVQQDRDVQQTLHLVPGLQLIQTGQAGGTTSLFTRGGNADSTKVLIDGVPANQVGGFTEFADIAETGFSRIEVLRAPNSTLYGADALAGVIDLTSTRGTTSLPEISYAVDGGNFGTYAQEVSLGGIWRRADYYSAYSRFDTANSIPHSQFHDGTYVGNFGWAIGRGTKARLNVRHAATADGNANAFLLYGIPDDATQKEQDTYLSATLEHEQADRWHSLLRYGASRLNGQFYDYAPTGIPYDPGDTGTPSAYLGKPVTLKGANGYQVSGQALYQFPGTYPSSYLTPSSRDFVYAATDYRFNPHVTGLFGFQYEEERASATATGSPRQSIERGNYSYRMQLAGDLRNRLHYTAGAGVEDNQLFGVEVTPRVSLSYSLLDPKDAGTWDGTKLRFSFGKGILEPSLTDQLGSLYGVLFGLDGGSLLIQQNHVRPVGAQRSRSYDGGVDQYLFHGKAKIGLTYFHNEFSDQIEFVPAQALLALGVPQSVESQIADTAGGAYVNSQSFRAQGIEAESEIALRRNLFLRAGYSYLDAVIQHSFTGDALSPSINPAFPTIPIGAYSPLIGARPFRRAPHTGYFSVSYDTRHWSASLRGSLVGKRDDSDFLSDANFGTTLLLPNRNLDAAYQRIDLHASYQPRRTVSVYAQLDNLLSQQTGESFGYPALPFTFRSGVRVTIGGESWRR